MKIKNSKNIEFAVNIAKNLSEWFTEEAIKNISQDGLNNELLIAKINEKIVGFLIYKIIGKNCEIQWLGVNRNNWRRNVGTKLIRELEKILKNDEIEEIFLSTLADTVNYEPYEITRKFFRKNGFRNKRVDKDFYPDGGDRLILHKKSK